MFLLIPISFVEHIEDADVSKLEHAEKAEKMVMFAKSKGE